MKHTIKAYDNAINKIWLNIFSCVLLRHSSKALPPSLSLSLSDMTDPPPPPPLFDMFTRWRNITARNVCSCIQTFWKLLFINLCICSDGQHAQYGSIRSDSLEFFNGEGEKVGNVLNASHILNAMWFSTESKLIELDCWIYGRLISDPLGFARLS